MECSADGRIPPEALEALGHARALLGDSIVGAYLFGSAVAGGLRVDSDVDVLVVVNRRLTDPVRAELFGRLMDVSGRLGKADVARPLEVTVLHLADVVPWRYLPRSELVYGEWLRKDFEGNRVPEPEPDPDLAIVLTKVREHGVAMLGPTPDRLLDPVPAEHLNRALGESLPGLIGGLEGDERNVLLTLARMWMTAATGSVVPKDVAAAWAVARLSGSCRGLLDMARRAYLGEVADRYDGRHHELAVLVERMKVSIEACLGESHRRL